MSAAGKPGRVRKAVLALIIRRTADAIRNMQNDGNTPWDNEALRAAGRGQRRFGGAEALAMVACEMVEAQGLTLPDAARSVREQSAVIGRFLDAIEAGTKPDARFLLAVRFTAISSGAPAKGSPVGQFIWIAMGAGHDGTAETVRALILGSFALAEAEPPGTRVNLTGIPWRTIAGPHIAVVCLDAAYRLLKRRARRAGFAVLGRAIVPWPVQEQDAAE